MTCIKAKQVSKDICLCNNFVLFLGGMAELSKDLHVL